jgi:uncharacterized protein (DUF433 family)
MRCLDLINLSCMNYKDRIEYNPSILLGKPIIKGTRIGVEQIIRKLAEGASQKDLLESYPQLQELDILASLTYASELIANEEVIIYKAS